MFARTLTIAMLSCTVSGCAMESEDPGTFAGGSTTGSWFALYQAKELMSEESVETGPGCVLAVHSDGFSLSSSTLSGELPEGRDLVLDMETEGKGLDVRVSSQGTLLTERSYDPAFLRSGDVDEFKVTTLDERAYQLVFWGAKECPSGG